MLLLRTACWKKCCNMVLITELIDWIVLFKVNIMNLSFFLLALSVEFVEANGRLNMFKKYHNTPTHGGHSKPSKRQIVTRKICTAQTCNKCISAFATNSLAANRNSNVLKFCSRVLTLNSCCPQKIVVRQGFWTSLLTHWSWSMLASIRSGLYANETVKLLVRNAMLVIWATTYALRLINNRLITLSHFRLEIM